MEYKVPTTLEVKYKIPKFLELFLGSSKIQNLLSLLWPLESLLGFFFCPLRPKSKMKNNHFFLQNFCMVFSSIIQNNKPKPKFF